MTRSLELYMSGKYIYIYIIYINNDNNNNMTIIIAIQDKFTLTNFSLRIKFHFKN